MRNPWKLTSFALIALLATATARGTFAPAAAEQQPKMHQALEALRDAATALEAAHHDKGGHRVKALQHTRAAIAQVQAGIRYDNRH